MTDVATTEHETIRVSGPRLQRIIDVLSVVSIGEFEPESVQIESHGEQDAFAMLEETMNILTHELGETRRSNDVYVEKLERSRQELEEKLNTIERQQTAIRDLSTPIIELWEDILTLPIIGVVDTDRSVDMTERLLHRIVETRSRCVIVDITGVEVVDTMTADHFVKMTKAAKMLGCHCVVTGISPDIAQTMVRLGVSLDGVRTVRNLKDGLKECFAFLRRAENKRDTMLAPGGENHE